MSSTQEFGFYARKRGHVIKNWKRRWFQCTKDAGTGKCLITYWASKESMMTSKPKGEIDAMSIEDPGNRQIIITDRTGKVYKLRQIEHDFDESLARLRGMINTSGTSTMPEMAAEPPSETATTVAKDGGVPRYSKISLQAISSLDAYETQLNEMATELQDIESRVTQAADDEIGLSGVLAELAQLNGSLDKLQATKIDSIITSELKSGNASAKSKRKELTRRCEDLQKRVVAAVKRVEGMENKGNGRADVAVATPEAAVATVAASTTTAATVDANTTLKMTEQPELEAKWGAWDCMIRAEMLLEAPFLERAHAAVHASSNADSIIANFAERAYRVLEPHYRSKLKALLEKAPNTKSIGNAKYGNLQFGDIKFYDLGLLGFVKEKDLQASIAFECINNENGKYAEEYRYVVEEKAREQKWTDQATNTTKIKDEGHNGWDLDKFCDLSAARGAKLKRAHVAVVRLYTGALYAPWNDALRALVNANDDEDAMRQLLLWRTCIAVLHDAIIRLSHATEAMKVMRGVDLSKFDLPQEFTMLGAKGFAGGVEMGFMSTTHKEEMAIQFSGGPNQDGVIFQIDFTEASKGANLQPFSMFPQEAEYLFPPFTSLGFIKEEQRGNKRYIHLNATTCRRYPDISAMQLHSCAEIPPWALTDQDGYYLFVAAQPPPVVSGNCINSKMCMQKLKSFADALQRDECLDSNMYPICVSDMNGSADALRALGSRQLHCLVWCATGLRWEVQQKANADAGDEANSKLSCVDSLDSLIESLKGLTRAPQIMFVCVEYGARTAAKQLLDETGVCVVVWISTSIFDADTGNDFMRHLIVDILQRMTHCKADLKMRVTEVVQSQVTQFFKVRPVAEPNYGIEVRNGATLLPWKPAESLRQNWLEQHFDLLPTNLNGELDGVSLLACDVSHVKRVQSRVENEESLVVWYKGQEDGGRGLERGRAVAQEVCMSLLRRGGGFRCLCRVAHGNLHDQLQQFDISPEHRFLLWWDVIASDNSDADSLLTQMKTLKEQYPHLSLLISGDNQSAGWIDEKLLRDRDLTLRKHKLGKEKLPLGAIADALHEQAVTLLTADNAGNNIDLIEKLGVDTFCSCIQSVIPDERPVLAMYVGDSGEIIVRMAISTVGFLHKLRDAVLIGDFEQDFKRKLEAHVQGLNMGEINIQAQRTPFAEMYESCVLNLRQLTPHQAEKLNECREKGELLPPCNTHIKAPAGGGKTYLALYLALELLEGDSSASVLFVAKNTALALFFSKWVCSRLIKDKGEHEMEELLERLHVLTESAADGGRRSTNLVLQTVSYENNGSLELESVQASSNMADYTLPLSKNCQPSFLPCLTLFPPRVA